ncbi:lipid-binding SYLF domain-containing protein [Thermodesulfatator atlanticus]|uniref:lipid-binding SYLF domain-containing protein n=1 Tax=Thermodesulfatator atlanticus TaxID=501497 RepID=UPI0003B719D5|nr:lipid-binding SYLF domain-containing protein [Thermodesulfatator atlanticus]
MFKKICFLVLMFVFFNSSLVSAKKYSPPYELVDKATITLKRFLADDQMKWMREHLKDARGILIIPQMLKGAFFIGGAGGSGVLLARYPGKDWSYPAFYTLGSVSFGLQFGGEASEIILLIMTQKGIDSFLATSVKLGGDVSVAAGPVGMGAKAQLVDILAFARSKGAFVGISLEGAVVKPRDSWNRMYYGRSVRPVDIIYGRIVKNPHADRLRGILRKYSR